MKLYIIQIISNQADLLANTVDQYITIDSKVYASEEEAVRYISLLHKNKYSSESYSLYLLDTETMSIGEITYNLSTTKKRVKK